MCTASPDNYAQQIHANKITEVALKVVIQDWMEKLNASVMILPNQWTRDACVLQRTILAMQANFTARMENVFQECGLAMEMTIAVIIQTKIQITVHSTLVLQTNSDVTMDAAFSSHGNVITRTIAKMDLMNWIVNIHHVLMVNLPVWMVAAFRKLKFAMELTTAKIMRHRMRPMKDAQPIQHAQPIISNARKLISVLNHTGFAMEITIVETTQTKMLFIVLKELAHKTLSDVQIIVASLLHGIVVRFHSP
jgi:hypothetical protein